MKKMLSDLFPVILFFAVFRWAGNHDIQAQSIAQQYLGFLTIDKTINVEQAPIILATVIAILATFSQILFSLFSKKKVEPMLWLSLGIITFLGGATIYFNSAVFIKWKPTVLYLAMGIALLISRYFFGINLLKKATQEQLSLPEHIWNRLNVVWSIFLCSMGILNLYVAYQFTTAQWVNFKLFGTMGLMFVFILAQGLFLSKYLKEKL